MAVSKALPTYLFCWLTLLIALILQVIPMPQSLLLFRPQWLAMALIYWCLTQPLRIGVWHGFICGLLLDLLSTTPLGQNALLLAAIAFLTLLLYQRLRFYSLWQQALMVMVMIGLALLVGQWLKVIFGVSQLHVQFVIAAILSGILWPWFSTLMRVIQPQSMFPISK